MSKKSQTKKNVYIIRLRLDEVLDLEAKAKRRETTSRGEMGGGLCWSRGERFKKPFSSPGMATEA